MESKAKIRLGSRARVAFTALKTSRDFEALRKDGQCFHPARWLMVNYRFQDLGSVRCAWTISRAVAPAVTRNRLRRWGREFFRKWTQEKMRSLDFNLIFKRQGEGFYQTLKHSTFDEILRKTVNRFENAAR